MAGDDRLPNALMSGSRSSPPFLGACSPSSSVPGSSPGSNCSDQVTKMVSTPIQDGDHPSKVLDGSAGSRPDASRLRDQLLRARRFTVGGSGHDMSPHRYSRTAAAQAVCSSGDPVSASSSRRGSLGTDEGDGAPLTIKDKKGKAARRASYHASTLHWNDVAESLRFGSRVRSATSPHDSTMETSVNGFSSVPTTPERKTKILGMSSPIRTSPITSSPIAAFRAAFRGPHLSSIPASPMSPPPPPGIIRSASSPPFLPSLPSTSPMSPIKLNFTPPTADAEEPPVTSAWPSSDTSQAEAYPFPVYTRPTFATSAPHLTLCIPAPTPISTETANDVLDTPFDSDDEAEIVMEAVFSAAGYEAARLRDKNRYHALLELVETETAYLESLRVLVNVS